MRRWALALVWLAGAVQAQVTVRFEADLGPEIAAGRFDPARDGVGLRGGFAPLSWNDSLPLAPLGGGRWGADVRFAKAPPGGQGVQHKFRIERPGLGPDEGWEPGRNHVALLEGPAPRVARTFGAEAVPAPSRLAGTIVTVDPVPTRHVTPRPAWVWLPPG